MNQPYRPIPRAYLPHLAALPFAGVTHFALFAQPPLGWLAVFAFLGLAGVVVFCWRYSGVIAGAALDPWVVVRWCVAPIRAWWNFMEQPLAKNEDDFPGCVVGFVGFVVLAGIASVLLSLARYLHSSSLAFAVAFQIVELVALTIALLQTGAFGNWATQAERLAAIAVVRSYYGAHADLLKEVFPTHRLDTELGMWLAPDDTRTEFWKAATQLIHTLQPLVREARETRDRKRAAETPPDPVHSHTAELRTLLDQLDAQIELVTESILKERTAGTETAWLERQLADLRRRRQSAADELDRLTRTEPPVP